MDPDFDKINYFIYSKIDNYNKHFDRFQKNLNIQDNKIQTVCKNKVNETFKKNSKKTAKKFIKLTEINESDDTSENEYSLEKSNIDNIKNNILKNNKKTMEGGNNDTETDISGEIEIIEEIENIEEEQKNYNFINYNFIYNTFIIILFLYIILYLLLILFKYPIDSNGIFKPLLFLTENIYPQMIKKNI